MEIRRLIKSDREIVIDMMRRFYNSPSLITNGSEKIFQSNVDTCINGSAYLEGYVFTVDDKVVGYGMIAKSFSTEFGSECIWIEDIFIEEEFRGKGYGSSFINFIKQSYPDKILRLEAEVDNKKAINSYEKNGFNKLPYIELVFTNV